MKEQLPEDGTIVTPNVIAETRLDNLSAWIAPDGRIHFTRYARHYQTAFIIDERGEEYLEDQGWIHLSGGFIRYTIDPTNAQIDALESIMNAIDVQVRHLLRYQAFIQDVTNIIKFMR